ncbi:PLDc N-terminal domain-containing protein [Pseudohalioglobus lutimaris]|uniref:Cardiolipin synthase N-terminal domain-containing protein n=1 Tax=Pseudohalioglobus lutimaris TaxID=1737061 RepID=A0A2N5X849_9GAMM|nr:PLDc N-terminal domain-containing protein [Pseudohalioglobus lutimaris]PLW70665.1 hypothetical protein C0039_00590 [Pseudohalioglobus lutimaris]
MNIEVTGIVGFLVLILDIWAILNIVNAGASMGSKLVWILVILLLPVIGVILWLLFGPRAGRA